MNHLRKALEEIERTDCGMSFYIARNALAQPDSFVDLTDEEMLKIRMDWDSACSSQTLCDPWIQIMVKKKIAWYGSQDQKEELLQHMTIAAQKKKWGIV